MSNFNIVAETSEATVVAEYTPEKRRSTDYQSEAELEKDFIHHLTQQGYVYIDITDEKDLIANLRTQLENLNHYTFSDKEWDQFYSQNIATSIFIMPLVYLIKSFIHFESLFINEIMRVFASLYIFRLNNAFCCGRDIIGSQN